MNRDLEPRRPRRVLLKELQQDHFVDGSVFPKVGEMVLHFRPPKNVSFTSLRLYKLAESFNSSAAYSARGRTRHPYAPSLALAVDRRRRMPRARRIRALAFARAPNFSLGSRGLLGSLGVAKFRARRSRT